MKKNLQKILLGAYLVQSLTSLALETSSQEELSLALTMVKAGKYTDAILKAQPLLDALKLDTVDSIVLGNKILAVSYCELGEMDKAKENFSTVQAFSPDEKLKDFAVSNECLEFFGLKKPTPKKPKPTTELSPTPESKIPQHLLPKETPWKLYVPFGTGQFYNRQPDKAWAFLSTEVVGLASAVTMFFLFQSEKNPDGSFSNTSRANAYKATYWSSLGLAGGAAVWGIIDGLVVHKNSTEDSTNRTN